QQQRSKSTGFSAKDAAATAAASTTKKPLTWDPNKARNERKGELIFLRKRVAHLEAKLRRLEAGTATATPSGATRALGVTQTSSPPPARTPPTLLALASPIAGLWEDISHRQCQERLRSERENVRLKLALERQLRIARTLDKIVHKKAVIKELEQCLFLQHQHPHQQTTQEEEPPTPRDPEDWTRLLLEMGGGVDGHSL
ncbi:hypothetical protein PybrP1_012612, partial [[Pythium] brassicae (nom. inval.)]